MAKIFIIVKLYFFSNVWMTWLHVNMSECVCVCVCVCVPDAWKACCVVNTTSRKHWAAGEQLVCDFLLELFISHNHRKSKFNLFHKQSVQPSFLWVVNMSVCYQLKLRKHLWKVILFFKKTFLPSKQIMRIHFHSSLYKNNQDPFYKKRHFCAVLTWNVCYNLVFKA